MNKTGKKRALQSPPSEEELAEMARRVCEEADRREARLREIVGRDEPARTVLYEQVKEEFARQLEVDASERRASSDMHREIVNFRHNQPGGSREKQQKIREIWASGKFKSRDQCAEQSCCALNMSFSSARKALRNQPNTTHMSKPASEWLHDLLVHSSRSSKDIYREARAAGYSRDAMKRAKVSIGAVVVKRGEGWFWYLKGAHRAATP